MNEFVLVEKKQLFVLLVGMFDGAQPGCGDVDVFHAMIPCDTIHF
jgi:hypothetical protein